MVYSVSRKGNLFAVVDSDNNFIDDEIGKKADMQAKADRLNAEQEEQAQNETNSVDDSDSSNTGNNSTGENEEQTEQVSTDKGLEEINKDDTHARLLSQKIKTLMILLNLKVSNRKPRKVTQTVHKHLSACTSKPIARPCQPHQPLTAALMQKPPNSIQTLERIISVSD